MDTLLPLLAYSLPFVMAIGLALVVIGYAGVLLGQPWLLMMPFLAALFWISANTFGSIDAVSSVSLLNRGSGVLLFPAFLWAILFSLVWIRFTSLFGMGRQATRMLPLTPWFAAWTVLMLGHVAIGVFSGISLARILSPSGFSHIVWLWVLVSAMVATFTRQTDGRRLALFIMAMGLARAVFGLVRFAAFGGDPVNAYANREGLTLKVTFFDLNDSLLCTLSMCIALVMLFRSVPAGGWRGWQKVLLWATVVLPALCIVLSFRRTVWVGTVLALSFVLLQLPHRVRWRLLVSAAPAVLVGIGYASWKRLSQVRGGGGNFLYDITSRRVGAESSRLLELQLAWSSFLDHPLLGVGSWGVYDGWRRIAWQIESGEGGGGAFLHSGVLHVALKTGLVGLVLLVGTVAAFVLAWRRLRRSLPAAAMPLAVAGVAGVLFTLPDWLLGTPVPQVRTMMLLGLCMSLPFVAERCFAGAAAAVPAQAGRSVARGRQPHSAWTQVRPS